MVTRLQNKHPPKITSFRRQRSPMNPAKGAPRAYIHMKAEPISPSRTLSKPNSSLSFGNTEKMAWRSVELKKQINHSIATTHHLYRPGAAVLAADEPACEVGGLTFGLCR